MIEEWKVVQDYSRYKVSNQARIWDTEKDLEVAQVLTGIPQYYYVNMQRDDGERKLVRVHRLVAKAFVEGETEEFRFVDHIDRDKLNNLPSNLRWVSNSGNQRNIESNIYVGEILLKDYVKRYENPEAAYSYIASQYKEKGIENVLRQYEEYLVYGQKTFKVEYDSEVCYLADLCTKYDKPYELTYSRISQGWPVWSALFCNQVSYPHSFEVLDSKGVGHWYANSFMFEQSHPSCLKVYKELFEKGLNLDQALAYDGKDHHRQTVAGVTGTISELCKHFGKTESSVSTRMLKGMSLEEALTSPPQRVKKVTIDGIVGSPKYWYEHFNLDYKTVKRKKDSLKCSFEDILKHFGVDLSGKVISYTD